MVVEGVARSAQVALALFALSLALPAPTLGSTVPIVGVLIIAREDQATYLVDLLRAALRKIGYEEPRNVVLDVRWAQGDDTRLPALAREILARKPAMMVSACGPALRAIRDVNRTIPVFADCAVWKNYHGEVGSMQHPGGATTGFMMLAPESAGKRLELLKEIQPRLARVAVLHNRVDDWQDYWRATERAAAALGLGLLRLPPIERAEDLEGALSHAVAGRAEALVVFPDATTIGAATQIAALAIRHRLLTAFDFAVFAQAGGLLSYGANYRELFEHILPRYIDKILKGASPANLPIVQPTTFTMVVNVRTAKALGVTIPQSVLLRADRVIE
jgi:putative ABC transport system substrate-binding protein